MSTHLKAELCDLLAAALDGGAPVLAGAPSADAAVQRLGDTDAALVLATSGSTGRPKTVVLSRSAIRASADSFRRRFGAFTWTCALPTHHIAGLMVLVRGILDRDAGGSGVLHCASDFSDATTAPGPNAISIVVTQLVRALRDGSTIERLRAYDLILVGGSAIDPELLTRGREAGLRLVTSYGMSETCGGCVFNSTPLDITTIRIDEEQRIWLAGPMRFTQYLADPQATAETLVDGEVRTSDRGSWVDDRLVVHGRFDDVIISGGVNVNTVRVELAAQALDPDVAVIGTPDPEWGQVVTLVTTGAVSVEAWRSALRATLSGPELPRRVVSIAEIPRTASGKIDRPKLRVVVESRRSIG